MGAEFFTTLVKAEHEGEVEEKYKDILSDLESEQALTEAEYLLDDPDNALDWLSYLDTQLQEDYTKGETALAIKSLADYLISIGHETVYTYTGTFLSSDSGLNFLKEKDEKGVLHLKEFTSIESAKNYISDNHKKWNKPMVAKIKDHNKWVIGAWCSS